MLSIIIPVLELKKKINPRFFYKKRFSFRDTLTSIKNNVKCKYELIIVVNDINNKDLVSFVKENKKIHKYILSSTNLGVPRAWNIGAMMAEGEHLCFCNDDVEVREGAVEKLIEVLESSNKVGQVGPAGGKWVCDKSGARVGLSRIEEADEVSGFFFIIKKNVFEEVGGFDNFYTPAGYEEIDMSFKIRSKGYKCLVVPQIQIIHHGSHGISATKTTIKYMNKSINTTELDKRNKAYFKSKWNKKLS